MNHSGCKSNLALSTQSLCKDDLSIPAARRCVRVGVPVELAQQPSMHGKLIRCEYFVRATLKMGLLAENVHIKASAKVTAVS